jgi:hypothetical protein
MGVQSNTSAALPAGRTHYSLHRRLDGPQSRSGCVRKIFLPPGFHPRTVQLVARRYINYTNPDYTEGNCMVGKFYIGSYGRRLSDL